MLAFMYNYKNGDKRKRQDRERGWASGLLLNIRNTVRIYIFIACKVIGKVGNNRKGEAEELRPIF